MPRKYKSKSLIERTNLRNRLSYHKKKYQQELNTIRRDLWLGEGGELGTVGDNLPQASTITARGLTNKQIEQEIRRLQNLRNQQYRDLMVKNAYTKYMQDMRLYEPNRFMDFIREYGVNPDIDTMRHIFTSDRFREVNGYVSDPEEELPDVYE